MTFEELYKEVVRAKAVGTEFVPELSEKEQHQLNCLLHPSEQPLVWKLEPCDCKEKECAASCIFHALEIKDGEVILNPENCVGCAECIEACKAGKLTFSRDTVRAVELLKQTDTSVYALMAPAFAGQFGEKATPSKLRAAMKQIGFSGMIEVAAFADILTLKEALEFYHNQEKPENFQLTSCCCPVWISLIRRHFQEIAGHLPPSVSPMIAAGRIVKKLQEGSKTIFIGPCIAKKSEAKEKDLAGAIDCVLTFQEMSDLLEIFKIDFDVIEEDEKEHSAKTGRLYARTGGVSSAVKECVESFTDRVTLKPVFANGVKECKELLEKILAGEIEGNFFEGMACPGGCIGGPKRILDVEKAAGIVGRYAKQAPYQTPGENPYVIEMIEKLGFHNVEDFIRDSDILTRTLEET